MISNSNKRLLYVSLGHGVHDRRFVSCAQGDGWDVLALRCDGRRNDELSQSRLTEWVGNKEAISEFNQNVFRSEFREIVGQVRPNLIQIGPLSNVAAVLDKSLGVPILAVSWARDLLHDLNESDWCREVAISAIQLASRILVDCKTVCEAALGLGASRGDVSIVPWGVDLNMFDFYQKQSISTVAKIVSIRSLEQIYSVSTLIEAAQQLTSLNSGKQFEFVIAGDGSLKANLENLANQYGLDKSLKFLGSIPEPDLKSLLIGCDVYVSTSPIDGSSISMLQAMALGLPCLVPDIPSNREWIEHEKNGFLFKPNDSRALAELLSEVTSKLGQLGSLSQKARKTVEDRADWASGCKMVTQIYKQIALQ